jgi:hypothetical protein
LHPKQFYAAIGIDPKRMPHGQICKGRWGVKMSSITINLQDEQVVKLQKIASRLGISVEDLARVSIEELLDAPDERFDQAADYVLKKNEDLYRRLA